MSENIVLSHLHTSECIMHVWHVNITVSVFRLAVDKLKALGALDQGIPSIHREMAKYLLSIGDTEKAREITMAMIESSVSLSALLLNLP